MNLNFKLKSGKFTSGEDFFNSEMTFPIKYIHPDLSRVLLSYFRVDRSHVVRVREVVENTYGKI